MQSNDANHTQISRFSIATFNFHWMGCIIVFILKWVLIGPANIVNLEKKHSHICYLLGWTNRERKLSGKIESEEFSVKWAESGEEKKWRGGETGRRRRESERGWRSEEVRQDAGVRQDSNKKGMHELYHKHSHAGIWSFKRTDSNDVDNILFSAMIIDNKPTMTLY